RLSHIRAFGTTHIRSLVRTAAPRRLRPAALADREALATRMIGKLENLVRRLGVALPQDPLGGLLLVGETDRTAAARHDEPAIVNLEPAVRILPARRVRRLGVARARAFVPNILAGRPARFLAGAGLFVPADNLFLVLRPFAP